MARLNLEAMRHEFKPRATEHADNEISSSDSEQKTAQPVKRKGRRLIRGVRETQQTNSDEGEEEDRRTNTRDEELSSASDGENGSWKTRSSPVKTKANESGNAELMKKMGGGSELVSRFSDLSLLPPQPGSERRKQRSLKSTREKSNTLFQRQGKAVEYSEGEESDGEYSYKKLEVPRRRANDEYTSTQRSRKRDTKREEETEDSTNEDEDEFDSLDEFIVGDDEAISTYEDTEEDTEEIEIEVLPKTPRRSPRKLFRGRKPASSREREDSIDSCNSDTTKDVNNTSPSPLLGESPGQQNEDDSLPSSPESDIRPQPSEASGKLPSDKMEPFDNVSLLLPTKNSSPDPAQPAGFVTPPASPSKPRLKSPTKSTKKIPPSPHKPELDSFWDQGETNEWNDKFSPRKTPMPGKLDFKIFEDDDDDDGDDHDDPSGSEPFNISPIKPPLTISSKNVRPSKQSRTAEASSRREQAARKREFDQKKDRLAKNFLKELDDLVTNGEVQRLAQSTGGVKITWNKKLATTAGRANWKREIGRSNKTTELVDLNSANFHHSQDPSLRQTPELQSSSGSGSDSGFNSGSSSSTSSPSSKLSSLSLSSKIQSVRHHAGIELAEKIIDSEDRLLNTLAHEYCHLANFMISNVRDQPHGTSFKQWASKCMVALATHTEYGSKVKITTKHSYVINYKYCWSCQACGQEYGRHSKSIDPTKVRCGKCKVGKLLQLRPTPRNVKRDANKTVPQRRAFGEVVSAGST